MNQIIPVSDSTAQQFKLKRTGKPPLCFTGERLVQVDNRHNGSSTGRWTCVGIYRTVQGRFVASIQRLTCWQGETDTCHADWFVQPGELIDFLKEGEDDLGSLSQEAVEKVCRLEPAFDKAWVEQVD